MVAESEKKRKRLERLLHRIETPTKDGAITICITQEEKSGSRLAMNVSLREVTVTHEKCRRDMRLERISETQQRLFCPECEFAIRFSSRIRTVGELDAELDRRNAKFRN